MFVAERPRIVNGVTDLRSKIRRVLATKFIKLKDIADFMERCWICNRTYEEVLKEIKLELPKESVMLTPDFMAFSKEIQTLKTMSGEEPSEGLNKGIIERRLKDIKICSICVMVILCGTHRHFVR